MNSIFQRSNPAIEKLFAEAGSPKKVMCIPIDYAKKQHTALVCNGEGMQLRGVFNVHNTATGVAFMEDIIKGLCKKHSIHKSHVFFGGEDWITELWACYDKIPTNKKVGAMFDNTADGLFFSAAVPPFPFPR